MAGTPKSRLGNYLEERQMATDKIKKRRKKENAQEALRERKAPGALTRENEMGVIAENGIDARDQRKRQESRARYRNDANDMIIRNELNAYERGFRYKDYTLDRKKAESRYNREQKKKRKGILEK